jgi:hypothetical protein
VIERVSKRSCADASDSAQQTNNVSVQDVWLWDFKFSRRQVWWRQYAPLKRRWTIILHGSISQKTTLNMSACVNSFKEWSWIDEQWQVKKTVCNTVQQGQQQMNEKGCDLGLSLDCRDNS